MASADIATLRSLRFSVPDGLRYKITDSWTMRSSVLVQFLRFVGIEASLGIALACRHILVPAGEKGVPKAAVLAAAEKKALDTDTFHVVAVDKLFHAVDVSAPLRKFVTHNLMYRVSDGRRGTNSSHRLLTFFRAAQVKELVQNLYRALRDAQDEYAVGIAKKFEETRGARVRLARAVEYFVHAKPASNDHERFKETFFRIDAESVHSKYDEIDHASMSIDKEKLEVTDEQGKFLGYRSPTTLTSDSIEEGIEEIKNDQSTNVDPSFLRDAAVYMAVQPARTPLDNSGVQEVTLERPVAIRVGLRPEYNDPRVYYISDGLTNAFQQPVDKTLLEVALRESGYMVTGERGLATHYVIPDGGAIPEFVRKAHLERALPYSYFMCHVNLALSALMRVRVPRKSALEEVAKLAEAEQKEAEARRTKPEAVAKDRVERMSKLFQGTDETYGAKKRVDDVAQYVEDSDDAESVTSTGRAGKRKGKKDKRRRRGKRDAMGAAAAGHGFAAPGSDDDDDGEATSGSEIESDGDGEEHGAVADFDGGGFEHHDHFHAAEQSDHDDEEEEDDSDDHEEQEEQDAAAGGHGYSLRRRRRGRAVVQTTGSRASSRGSRRSARPRVRGKKAALVKRPRGNSRSLRSVASSLDHMVRALDVAEVPRPGRKSPYQAYYAMRRPTLEREHPFYTVAHIRQMIQNEWNSVKKNSFDVDYYRMLADELWA